MAPSPSEKQKNKTISFNDLELSAPLLQAIEEIGYKTPTEIQVQAIPAILMGRDILGVAQTGTGKTASFTLPLLEILSGSRARARMPRSLILAPTRELALQVAENFQQYGRYTKLTHALLIGGESMTDQKETLNKGVDVLIATPGRLLDLFERGGLLLNQIRALVIDEADRMLDMGFIPDVEKIINLLPTTRQTLLFSATIADEIKTLADKFLFSPLEITIASSASVASTLTAKAIHVTPRQKNDVIKILLEQENIQSAITFCNRKRDVDILVRFLRKNNFSAQALHGDLTQSLRTSTLEKFRTGDIKILICSDIAARGIDVDTVSHVFNYDLPRHPEDYVHRIGRAGRAGRTGYAYSLVTDLDQKSLLAIEKLIGTKIEFIDIEEIKPSLQDTPPQQREKARSHSSHRTSSSPRREPAHSARISSSPDPLANEEVQNRGDGSETIRGFGNMIPSFMLRSPISLRALPNNEIGEALPDEQEKLPAHEESEESHQEPLLEEVSEIPPRRSTKRSYRRRYSRR
uniref:DEAD/DEAH box helicase n=1 Tax=Entomobacter blattae TaxID=2762277 RepID=UPI001EF15B87|nr:DEAD/DEAH box helicase [Entomobacter blattae]